MDNSHNFRVNAQLEQNLQLKLKNLFNTHVISNLLLSSVPVFYVQCLYFVLLKPPLLPLKTMT